MRRTPVSTIQTRKLRHRKVPRRRSHIRSMEDLGFEPWPSCLSRTCSVPRGDWEGGEASQRQADAASPSGSLWSRTILSTRTLQSLRRLTVHHFSCVPRPHPCEEVLAKRLTGSTAVQGAGRNQHQPQMASGPHFPLPARARAPARLPPGNPVCAILGKLMAFFFSLSLPEARQMVPDSRAVFPGWRRDTRDGSFYASGVSSGCVVSTNIYQEPAAGKARARCWERVKICFLTRAVRRSTREPASPWEDPALLRGACT